MRPIAVALTSLSVALLAATQLGAAEYNPVRTRPAAKADSSTAQRFIVKLRASGDASRLQAQASNGGESASASGANAPTASATASRMNALAVRAHIAMESARGIAPNLQVMHVSRLARGEPAADTLARLRGDPDVEYAEIDRRIYPQAVSNDPLAVGQWYLQAAQPSAINANGAWDTTTGSNGVVVAVIDTGVRFNHADLRSANQGGRLLAGYDFVSGDPGGGFLTANDGDGRDANAADPGDWVTQADVDSPTTSCTDTSDSSWHGTRVSGIIGALSNNSVGVSGITWSGWTLPVRVIGKCGGYNSDVLAGMRWAAGLSVPGVPANPYPAQVLNISLGGEGSCDSSSADVTSELASNGVLIVVAAGNEGGPVDSPANCPGAMGIAGLRHAGTKVGFSSLGPEIALSAPGGNCVDITGGPCQYSIDTTSNDGATTPGNNIYTSQTNPNIGTSFSAPIVSGIAGLMLAVNGNLKSTQLIARLKEGATKPFPTTSDTGTPPACQVPTGSTPVQNFECSCTTSTCGAGMANANGAVAAALRPIAAIALGSTVAPGQNVTLQGGGSAAACNHTVAAYAWTVVSSTGTAPTINNANTATATVPAPATGTTTIRLTVTDEAGKTDAAQIVIGPTSANTAAPANAGSTACLAAITIPQVLPQITVAATDASASEAGPDTGTFTFTRTGDAAVSLSVGIALTGTAANATDYQSIGASATFAAGVSTTTLTVTPIDNNVVGTGKTAIVTVQSGADYTIGTPSSATVTIADNDVAPPAPPSGGGGGAIDWMTLMATLAALTLVARGRNAQQRAALQRARSQRPASRSA